MPEFSWTRPACTTREDLYLWPTSEPRPDTPAVADVGDQPVMLADPLLPGVEYSWQIVARSGTEATPGPVWSFRTEDPPAIRRGDTNEDGQIDISDSIRSLLVLFGGMEPGACPRAGDVNNDDGFDISDPIALLQWLYVDGQRPPEPFLQCGPGGSFELPCDRFEGCQ
jgi:hypothetical protein